MTTRPACNAYDPSWSLDYTALSDGNEGEALVSIFDKSLAPFDPTTDPWELAARSAWSIWRTDIDARTGAPISGIPLNAGAYTPVIVDGRVFVMVPKSDFSATELYEIDGTSATPSLVVPGWSYMLAKIE